MHDALSCEYDNAVMHMHPSRLFPLVVYASQCARARARCVRRARARALRFDARTGRDARARGVLRRVRFIACTRQVTERGAGSAAWATPPPQGTLPCVALSCGVCVLRMFIVCMIGLGSPWLTPPRGTPSRIPLTGGVRALRKFSCM